MFKKHVQKKPKNLPKMELVLAALGVIGDETQKPASIDDIGFCLQIDFKQKIREQNILELLNEAKNKDFCSQSASGWTLSKEGEIIADKCLKELSE
jgi:hypothetical protein